MDTEPTRADGKRISLTIPRRADPMRHFAREAPFVKLCALFVVKLPAILAAASGTVSGLLFWFWHFR